MDTHLWSLTYSAWLALSPRIAEHAAPILALNVCLAISWMLHLTACLAHIICSGVRFAMRLTRARTVPQAISWQWDLILAMILVLLVLRDAQPVSRQPSASNA